MAVITNLAFAISSEWNDVGVRAAMTDFTNLDKQITALSKRAIDIKVATNAPTALAQLEKLQAAAKDRDIAINVKANTAAATAGLDEAAAAATNLQAAEEKLSAALTENASAAASARTANRTLSTAMKAATDSAAAQTAALEGTTAAQTELGAASTRTAAAQSTQAARSSEAAAATSTTAAAAAGLGTQLNTAGKVATAVFAVGIIAATKSAADFQQAMTLLVTSAGLPKEAMDSLGKALLDISSETGTAANDLAAASYKVLSLGFDWQQTAQIMHTTAELAKVDNSDLVVTTQAVVQTLHDYGLAADQNVSVANALRAAVERSNTTLADFSDGIGRVEQSASALHMSFTQIYGALATLTEQGLPARNSIMLLTTTIDHLASSTPKSSAELEALGLNAVKFHQVIASKNGLTEGIKMLNDAIANKLGPDGLVYLQQEFKKSKGDAEAFAQALGNAPPAIQTTVDALGTAVGGVRNLSVILGLSGDNFARFQDNVDHVAEAAAHGGTEVDGWAVKQQTFNQRMSEFKQTLVDVFVVLGNALLPAMTTFFGGLLTGTKWLADHKAVLEGIIIALGVIAAAWIAVKVAMIAAAVAGSVFALWVIAIGAVVAGLVLLVQHTEAGRRAWADFTGFFKKGDDGASGFSRAVGSVRDSVEHLWNSTEPLRKAIGDLFGPSVRGTIDEVKKSFGDLKTQFDTSIKPAFEGLMSTMRPLWDALKPVLAAIGGALLLIGKIVWEMFNGAIRPVFGFLGDLVTNVINLIKGVVEVITGFFNAIVGFFQFVFNAVKTIFGLIKGIFTGDWSTFFSGIHGMVDGLKKMLFDGFGNIAQGLWHIVGAMWDTIYSIVKRSVQLVVGVVEGFVRGVIGFFDMLGVHVDLGKFFGGIIHWFAELPGKAMDLLRGLGDGIGGFFSGLWNTVSSAVGNFFGSIIDSVVGFTERFVGFWVSLDVKIVKAVGGWIGGVLSAVANFFDPVTRRFREFFEGLFQILVILEEGVLNKWREVWGKIKEVAFAIWTVIQHEWDVVLNALKAVWDTVSGVLGSAWNAFWDTTKQLALAIWTFFRTEWDLVWGIVRGIWDAFSSALGTAWNAWWDTVKQVALAIWTFFRTEWDFVWGIVRGVWDKFADGLKTAWDGFWNWIHDVASSIWDRLKSGWEAFAGAIKNIFTTLKDDIGKIWDGLLDVFKRPINLVINTWNDKVVSHFPGVTKVEPLATGGPVVGPGGPTDDQVPLWGSNGEHMWTAQEVNAAGGHGVMYAWRKAVLNRRGNPLDDNRFAGGGAVERLATASEMARDKGDGRAYVYGGSGPDGFDCSGYMSAIYNVLTNAANWWSRAFSTESDFGALGFKQGLGAGFAIGVHNGGGGMLSHMAGTLDGVNVESGGPHDSTLYGGAAVGADHPQFENQYFLPIVDGEFVSGGPGGGGGRVRQLLSALFNSITTPFLDAIPDPFPGTSKPFGDFPKSAATKVRDAITDWIKGHEAQAVGMAFGGGGALPEGVHLQIINDALNATGTPPPDTLPVWQEGLNTLIGRESGWDPYAVNNSDSNAAAGIPSKGLAQVIQPTFDAYHQAGTSYDIFDAIANVSAAVNYIKARYGSITSVQQADASRPPMGYALGTQSARAGWSIVGEHGPEAVNFRGGEPVYSFDDIMRSIKAHATGTSEEMSTKIEAALQRLGDRLQNQSEMVRQSIEDAVNRALSDAGVGAQIHITGNTPDEIMNQLQAQLFPKLEMMLRQGVGG